MKKKELKTRDLIGISDFTEKTLVIECDLIKLRENGIEIKIENSTLNEYETITINGITYKKENKK